MIEWPAPLVQDLVAKRCILFLGSGVSVNATITSSDPMPDWQGVLSEARNLLLPADHAEMDGLIGSKNYLLALQFVYNRKRREYETLLNQMFNNRRHKPGSIHAIVNALDPKVVVTTNVDRLYEAYWHSVAPSAENAFKVIPYSEPVSLANELKSDARLIIKAHGSIDIVDRMIFTRDQYHAAKRDYSGFYKILKALFITNTVLFLGCGLNDPDICLLLEELTMDVQGSHPHYVVCKRMIGSALREDWRKTYNIEALEYSDHADLESELTDLLNQVKAKDVV